MNINLNNYEAYFLDYYEGNLSPALIKELMDFLAKHSELRPEFESFEIIELPDAEGAKYEGKEKLKKPQTNINASNFDDFAIEYVEGILSFSAQQELITFINQNPEYKRELELYSKTKLTPDTAVVFGDKLSLKKTTRRPTAFYYWSAAASVAIIIGAYFIFNKNNTAPNANSIAMHNQTKEDNTVANNTAQLDNTTGATQKTSPNVPITHNAKSNAVAIKIQHSKQPASRKIISNNIVRDSSALAINKAASDLHAVMSTKKQSNIPADSTENNAVAYNGNNKKDSSFISSPTKQNNTNNLTGQQIAANEIPKKKKKGKLLLRLVAAAFKGIHKITGQHIELEQKYDSDDKSIVAYQLDLGNKKLEFPVKE